MLPASTRDITKVINLLRAAGNFGKICFACWQGEFKYKKRINKQMYNWVYKYTCVFFYTPCTTKITRNV
jgi:hypothetical protein